ncbi:MAG: U32 family peptidase [Euryarchaeota archaeon]|jgi:putative protease|nr:U32 family peptidase [Euryarchaeota archaeon]HHT19335.1 U32 family peptidase [Methanobacterium sp.]
MVELLAPARDFTALEAALKNGANAVYIGVENYNMRSHAPNFTMKKLKEASDRCHSQNARLYVCTNTVMNNRDIEHLNTILPDIVSAGADAIIASDLGVLNIAQDEDIDVHFSVQGNISNSESVKVLADLGVKRVILSRELSLEEIKRIIRKSPLEVEVFVHGAMCLAISGRCFLSSYLYQKNANCGECLQPCRKEWKLISNENDDDLLSLKGDNILKGCDGGFKGHILSPRDLCMIEHIPKLIEAGISSFKIEGRARPADYVATVTRVYRQAIDSYKSDNWKFNDEWMDELKKVYNRGFDTGFYFKPPFETSSYNQATLSKKDVGEVVNYYSKVKAAEIRLWNHLTVGDEIVVEGPSTGSITQTIESIQIEHENVFEGRKGQNIGISIKNKVRPGDLVYRRVKRR